jgi:16S rRNA (adenine1518-N6/adenine1519-N6)-dimethyltransferase
VRERRLVEVRPKRSLGQNFLRARWVARIFARWACRYSMLLEVGVGTGFLTRFVASECPNATIVGVEVDERLLDHLAALRLYSDSILPVLSDALHPPVRFEAIEAVYGSIPYNITGPLLALLALEARKPALLLLQREVAERLASQPGSHSYGRITVLVQLVYEVSPLNVVPPSAFTPRPKVYSRIVELKPRSQLPPRSILYAVEEVTKCMFSQRNKKAAKIAARCCGDRAARIVEERYGGLRVYQLPPNAFLEIAEVCGGDLG